MLLKQGKKKFNLSKLIWAISSQGYVSATESRDPNRKPRGVAEERAGRGVPWNCFGLPCVPCRRSQKKTRKLSLVLLGDLDDPGEVEHQGEKASQPPRKIGHRFPLKTHQTSWQVRRNQPNLKWGPALGTPGTSSWGSSPRETSGPASPQGKIGHRFPP